jgi:E3 ubiquitin-protein ligase HERC2
MLGVLMAMALLQKETVVSLSLCSVFWKQLVQQPAESGDLAGFDEAVCSSLGKIEHIEDEGVDEELFADLIFESFTTVLSNGTEAEVVEGGTHIDVTWHNRAAYCAAVRRARLREGSTQTHAVLRGINSLLPVRLLALFTHAELELMTCGTPEVDVAILRQHTRYGVSVNPNDPHITILWEVLTSLSMEQRSMFLSFIWGRNRLPATEDEWGEQCMKIHTLENSRPGGPPEYPNPDPEP